MKMRNWLMAATAVASCFTMATSANAASYLLTYGGPASFSATVTTTDVANPQGFFTVTGLSGTRGGIAVSLLPTGSLGGNDNLLKPTVSFMTFNGISFTAGATSYNIYLDTPPASYRECFGSTTQCENNVAVTGLTVTPLAGPVPEPATWGMMILGFGAIGSAVRYRRRSTKVAFG